MDRKEFCELMAKAKKESGKDNRELAVALESPIYLLNKNEKGKNNFKMDFAINYLRLIGYCLSLSKKDDVVLISTYSQIPFLFSKEREGVSKKQVCDKVGISSYIISSFEELKAAIGVDEFLKLADVFDFSVSIERVVGLENHNIVKQMGMDRKEFCDLILNARKKSLVDLKVLASAIKNGYNTIKRIETGAHSFNLGIAISYLHVLGYRICLTRKQEKVYLSDISSFTKLVDLDSLNTSYKHIAIKIGVSYETVYIIGSGKKKSVGIDIFLKLIGFLGYTLTLEKNKEND